MLIFVLIITLNAFNILKCTAIINKCSSAEYDPVISLVQPCIDGPDNNLRGQFSACIQIRLPDLMASIQVLYQYFWELCGDAIFPACSSWLNCGTFPPINDTNIVLLPKCELPQSMKDLRPVALCNVIYRILAKVLANRLKTVIAKCISEEQSAFVQGRSILDNALVAAEILHYLKCKNKGKTWEVALKIDISKAYDRVDWRFLEAMMRKMGFEHKWIGWIMHCVTNVRYSILSPYLFIIRAKGLSSLIRRAERRGDFHVHY